MTLKSVDKNETIGGPGKYERKGNREKIILKPVKPGDVMRKVRGSFPESLSPKLQGSIFRKKSKNNSIDDKVDNISDIKSMQFIDDK